MKARSKFNSVVDSFIKIVKIYQMVYYLVTFSINDEDMMPYIMNSYSDNETIKPKLLKPCITTLLETNLLIYNANVLNCFHVSGTLV